MLFKFFGRYAPSLSAAWAISCGLSEECIKLCTRDLLCEIDELPYAVSKTGVILGTTLATVFAVNAALKGGHNNYVVVGGKSVKHEKPTFTKYIMRHMSSEDKKLINEFSNLDRSEAFFAEWLLIAKGVDPSSIRRLSNDNSMHTGANMKILAENGFGGEESIELYTLAGYGLRALMTARRELGTDSILSVHHGYPEGVDHHNWHNDSVCCAHIAGEAAKVLGENPLYVSLGYAARIKILEERYRIERHVAKYYDKKMI